MAYSARILLDSVNPVGDRLTTFEVSFPRVVLAEFNTHRMLSRNSASSRAIPVEKMLRRVMEDPYVPVHWGQNQPGMQAAAEVGEVERERALAQWLQARDEAVATARRLHEIGVHKQVTNRLLEPFLWHTVIVSATTYDNFFALRCHPAAMPEIRRVAEMMRDLYLQNTPESLAAGQWHLPLLSDEDRVTIVDSGDEPPSAATGAALAADRLKRVSAGRCARVSYLTHDGRRDPAEDVALCGRLAEAGHMSPLEHVAQAQADHGRWGNYTGWKQFRHEFADEAVFRG